MPNIFISYSHKDRDFVRKLHDRLKDDNYDIWVDFEDIPLSAEWWLEIKEGIDSADNFFFVITPDSVQSKVCNQELQYALDNNKRIVPLLQTLIIDPDISAEMRPEIEKINWVRFDDADTFDENYVRLKSILESGLEHIQEHTRLLIRAREWGNNGKKRAYLLDQRNLRLARQWLNQAQGKEPAPTVLHQEYIDASINSLRRSRILRAVLAGVATLVGVFVIGTLALVALNLVLVTPYQQKIEALLNRSSSFRVMRSPMLIDLAIDEGSSGSRYTNLEEMNPYILHAALSLYDPDFFSRSNADYTQNLVDLLHVVINGVPQPTSVSPIALLLTQNSILDAEFLSDRDMIRYAEEQVVSSEIDRNYAKRDVLEIFLNDLYFGNQTYGIGAASEWYFDTDPSKLDIAQVAFLMGISINPPRYDPAIDTEAALDQMDEVIKRMFEVGCLDLLEVATSEPLCVNQETTVQVSGLPQPLFTSAEGDTNSIMELFRAEILIRRYESQSVALAAPHFVNLIEQELYDLFGNQSFYNEALRVETAFDPVLQAAAEMTIQNTVDAFGENGIDNAAFIATRPEDGALIALVGSVDPTDSQTGNAALDFRRAGSVMHPVTYLATLSPDETGTAWFPGTIVWDVPTSYNLDNIYVPKPFDGLFRGPVPLRVALANSLNVPTVATLMHVGFDRFAETVDAIGFQFGPGEPISLSSAVGANSVRLIDIATAYGTLANGGAIARPHAVVSIIDRDGQTIYEADKPSDLTVSPENAFLVTSMLTDADAAQLLYGNYRAELGPEFLSGDVAIIPGFTDPEFSGSLWAVGYTPNIVGAFWMGNFDHSRIFNVTAMDAVGEWGDIMRVSLKSAPDSFEMPDGITTFMICPEDGTLYADTCPSPAVEEFARKDQPPPPSGEGELLTLMIDSWTGKIANENCPVHTIAATYLTTDNPFALQWIQNSPAGQNWAQRVNLNTVPEAAPTTHCQPGDPLPVVRIDSPQEGQSIQDVVSIVGTATGPDFESYQLLVAPTDSIDFVTISPEITQVLPSAGSELHTWDTRMVPNGEYMLRLRAISTRGGFIDVERTITVENP